MELKKPLPNNRTFDQIYNHFLVEKSLADQLRAANREERKKIYSSMYDELFSKVPDHPRLTKRDDKIITRNLNTTKFKILKSFIKPNMVFAEFGPGDCKFSLKMTQYLKFVYGIDISDQRDPNDKIPENFKLIIYNGYDITDDLNNNIDLVFSDQLIEHFHPEDTKDHFKLVLKILKPGGKYIFKTPHALSGPKDISQYFSDEPLGFHLKEWMYKEIRDLLKSIGYADIQFYWTAKGYKIRLPKFYFVLYENFFKLFSKKYTRSISKIAIPSLMCIAVK